MLCLACMDKKRAIRANFNVMSLDLLIISLHTSMCQSAHRGRKSNKAAYARLKAHSILISPEDARTIFAGRIYQLLIPRRVAYSPMRNRKKRPEGMAELPGYLLGCRPNFRLRHIHIVRPRGYGHCVWLRMQRTCRSWTKEIVVASVAEGGGSDQDEDLGAG